MSGHVKVAIAVFFVFVLAIAGFYFGEPVWQNWRQQKTSDAGATKGKISIAVDNWVGYFPLCSPRMKVHLRRAGWLLDCVDDKADYASRMKNMKDGKYNFAVATVDSYILNAASLGFPGVIVAVIDESKGGDAILAWKDSVANLDDIKGKSDLRIVFTPNSPSHHLIKAVKEHFGIPEILPSGKNKIESDGSEAALKTFLAKKADVAVLWEPDVTRALSQKGVVKLLGTEDTKRLIVDILLVNRQFSSASPEVTKFFISTYFRVLKEYRDSPDELLKDVVAQTKLSESAVKSMLKGVSWVNLTDNAQEWFGVSLDGTPSADGLISAIESTVSILVGNKDFSSNPLPAGDPYRITQSQYVQDLFGKGVSGFTVAGVRGQKTEAGDSIAAKFQPLSESAWANLREIGSLRIAPIVFSTGVSELGYDAKLELDKVAEKLKHYPNFRILIKGHTGLSGDKDENRKLSQERAESVARYFEVTYGVDSNRVLAVGKGSDEPLPKAPGESSRGHNYRLPRVEIRLVSEVY